MAGERILVIDDDPFTLELLTETLSEQGYHPVAAQDGSSALEILGKDRFQVALVDLSLPGVEGMELVREISSATPETAVVIMTGYPTLDSAIQALRQGACDYIVKPFKIQEVTAAVEKALAQQKLRNEVAALRSRVRDLEQELRRHQEPGGMRPSAGGGMTISPGGVYGGRRQP